MKNIIIFFVVALLAASCGSAPSKPEDSGNSAKTQESSGFSITLDKVDGGTFSFEDIRGKKHLVAAFWATSSFLHHNRRQYVVVAIFL